MISKWNTQRLRYGYVNLTNVIYCEAAQRLFSSPIGHFYQSWLEWCTRNKVVL